jgi:hypothetical protein
MLIAVPSHAVGATRFVLTALHGGYVIGATHQWGKTAGKAIVRSRVCEDGPNTPPHLRSCAVRWFVGWGGWSVLSLSASSLPLTGSRLVGSALAVAGIAVFAPILWRADRRGLHDLAAHTNVIDERRL